MAKKYKLRSVRGILFPIHDKDRYISCTVRHFPGKPSTSIALPKQLFSIRSSGDPYEDVISIQSSSQTVYFKLYYVKKLPLSFRTRHDGEVIMFRMARRSLRLINARTGDFELAQRVLEHFLTRD